MLLAGSSPAPQCLPQRFKGTGNFDPRKFDARRIFDKIRRDGSLPGIGITLAAIKQCGSEKDLESGRRIHAQLLDSPAAGNVFVANTLIDMYSKCGSVGEARRIFEDMETDRSSTVVSWNTIIAGYVDCCQPRIGLELFQRMLGEGFRPDARTLVAALRACAILALEEEDGQIGDEIAKIKLLETGLALHSLVYFYGIEANVYVANTLIDMYGKCSSMADARRVFDRCSGDRGLISWNTLLMGYAESGNGEEAMELFQMMHAEFDPDSRSYTAVIKACARSASKEDGRLFEGQYSASIEDSFSTGNRDDREMIEDGSSLIGLGDDRGSSNLSIRNRSEEISAGRMNRAYKTRALERGFFLHAGAARDGFDTSVFVANALIEMYGKCGTVVDARRIFDTAAVRNVVTWGNMVLAYAENGEAETALRIFQAMRKDAGLDPDSGAYIAALRACGVLADLDTGKALHEEIRARNDLAQNSILETCVLDFYAKCGSMADARSVFDSMPRRDLIAWNTLIAGYADQGDVDRCVKAFEDMSSSSSSTRCSRVRPDGVTFLSLLSACSHAGLVDRARFYFDSMRSPRFGVAPGVEHYNCMVDVLGRGNQIEEAMAMVEQMPHGGNARLWTSLLSSCRKWGNVGVGKIAFESLVALGDRGAPAYVLLANSYENVLNIVD